MFIPLFDECVGKLETALVSYARETASKAGVKLCSGIPSKLLGDFLFASRKSPCRSKRNPLPVENHPTGDISLWKGIFHFLEDAKRMTRYTCGASIILQLADNRFPTLMRSERTFTTESMSKVWRALQDLYRCVAKYHATALHSMPTGESPSSYTM